MLKKIVLTLFVVGVSQLSFAQNKLTIEDAIAKGLENNYGIVISALESDIAARNNTWGAAGAYPTITGTAQYNFSKEMIQSAGSVNSSVGASVDANWTLFNGFRIRIAKRVSEYKFQLSKGNEAIEIENCIYDVVMAYYGVVLEKELLAFNKTLYTLSKDRFERDKHQSAIGGKGTYELIQSESAYLSDYQSYLSQERRVRESYNNLNLAMGIDTNQYWETSTSVDIQTKEYVLAELKDMMMSSNKTLLNQYINQKVREGDEDAARGDLMPKLDLKAGGRYNYMTQSSRSTLEPYVGVTISATIFAGNVKQRNIAIANIRSKIESVSTDQMKRELNTQLMNQYDIYDYNCRLLELSKRELEVAKINLDLSAEKFKNSSISSFDYRAVQLSYQQSAYSYQQIAYAVVKANTELTRLIGGFVK